MGNYSEDKGMGRHPVEAGLSTSKAMLALILLPVVTWASPVVENPSVDLTVYFESLCPDSIKFVSRDVPAAWRLFGPDLRISFKPFGKASWSHHDPDEHGVEFDFECQHGPDECFGNKVLACALWFVEEPALQVPFMECLVKTHEMPDWGLASCIDSLHLASPSADRILGCANGGEGADLLFDLGVETKSLDPPLLWVPWTTFNGVYIESEWNAAIDDLTGFLCSSHLAGHPNCP